MARQAEEEMAAPRGRTRVFCSCPDAGRPPALGLWLVALIGFAECAGIELEAAHAPSLLTCTEI